MQNCVPHFIQQIAKIPQTLLMILAYQTLATYREDMYWLSITSRILSPIVVGNLYTSYLRWAIYWLQYYGVIMQLKMYRGCQLLGNRHILVLSIILLQKQYTVNQIYNVGMNIVHSVHLNTMWGRIICNVTAAVMYWWLLWSAHAAWWQ